MGSYGFRFLQKSLTLMTVNVNHCSVVSAMRIVTKRLRLESCCFRYKVTLYLSYLHIKFDDEIRRESLRILSLICD